MPPKKKHLILTDADIHAIADVTAETLQKRRSMTPEQHNADHIYVQRLMERDRKREALWESIKERVAKDGAWYVLVGLVMAVALYIKAWLKA